MMMIKDTGTTFYIPREPGNHILLMSSIFSGRQRSGMRSVSIHIDHGGSLH